MVAQGEVGQQQMYETPTRRRRTRKMESSVLVHPAQALLSDQLAFEALCSGYRYNYYNEVNRGTDPA